MNCFTTSYKNSVIDSSKNYEIKVKCKPRNRFKKFDFKSYLIEKTRVWDIKTSIFCNYVNDSDELIKQCFEFDFDSSKIHKLVKNEVDEVKTLLSEYYPYLFHAYKYYASQGSFN